jgi:hydrogenase maturation protease
VKTLVAGFGNVFFGDDAFGAEVVRALGERPPGGGVRVRDFGISGMHLALEMLEPYDRIVLVDAIARDAEPGTVYAVEPETFDEPTVPDGHSMDVRSVLALYARMRRELGAQPAEPQITIIGCVPQTLAEGMTLSEPVRAAVPTAVRMIRSRIGETP